MDVECEPGCSFSTGSYSDSVRELAGEPGQHPNKLTMARFDDAASLLLLELDLAWADAGPWSYLLLTHVARFFWLLLIGEGSKGDQLYGGGTGRPRCGVSCLGSLCYFLTLTLYSCLCMLRAIRMSYSTVF